jgi:putative oxidoreductase
MKPYFPNLKLSLVLLRWVTAIIFIAHAVVRIGNGTISQFSEFLESKGLPMGVVIVWAITVFEIVGGALMASGYFTRWIATGFILLLVIGIVLIHAELGWFVGEHGTGGMEYSVVLIFALLVVGADNSSKHN